MKKSFEIDHKTDPNLLDITLSDERDFSIEITASTEQVTTNMRLGIRALIMGYNNHNVDQLNFHIDDSCQKYAKVVGNISNALDFLKKNRFMSEALVLTIKMDFECAHLLNKSNNYIELSESVDNLMMPKPTLEDDEDFGLRQASSNDRKKSIAANGLFGNSAEVLNQSVNAQKNSTLPTDNSNKPSSSPIVKVK